MYRFDPNFDLGYDSDGKVYPFYDVEEFERTQGFEEENSFQDLASEDISVCDKTPEVENEDVEDNPGICAHIIEEINPSNPQHIVIEETWLASMKGGMKRGTTTLVQESFRQEERCTAMT